MEETDVPQQASQQPPTPEPKLTTKQQIMKWSIAILLLLLLCYIAKCTINKDRDSSTQLSKHIEDSLKNSYNAIIQSKESQILSLNKKVFDLNDSNMALQTDIANYSVLINQIQTQTHVKIKYVNSLSSDDLAKFFLSRYGSDSTRQN